MKFAFNQGQKRLRRRLTLAAAGAAFSILGMAGLLRADGSALLSAPKEGEVLSIADREKLLASVDKSLNRANPDLETRLKVADNPFVIKQPPPPVNESATSAAPTAPVAVRMSDADKLKEVADELHASGVLGNYLISAFKPLQAGQYIDKVFTNETAPTRILLKSVSGTSYVLQLNGTQLSFEFFSQPISGATNNASSANSPSSSTPAQ
jgi:hypothetical protein